MSLKVPLAILALTVPASKAAVMSLPPNIALCASAPSGYAAYHWARIAEEDKAVTGIVMLPEPSKPVAVPVAAPERAIVRLAASLVAVAALPVHDSAVVAVVAVAALPVQEPDDPLQLPVRLALIVAGKFSDTLALPFTLTAVLVLVPSVIVMLRAVPQLAVVILAVPLNEVPLMVRAVYNFVAVAALPVHEPEEPVTEPTIGFEKVFVPAIV